MQRAHFLQALQLYEFIKYHKSWKHGGNVGYKGDRGQKWTSKVFQPCQPVSSLITTCFQCVSHRLGLKLLPTIDFLLRIDCNQHSKLNGDQIDDSNHWKETCGTLESNNLIQLWCVEAQLETFVGFSTKSVSFSVDGLLALHKHCTHVWPHKE